MLLFAPPPPPLLSTWLKNTDVTVWIIEVNLQFGGLPPWPEDKHHSQEIAEP